VSLNKLLVFGGPYSNYAATKALLDHATALGFAPEQVLCTGDMVAYCSDVNETLALMQDWHQRGMHIVKGNCEQSLAEQTQDCGCGFDENSACSLLSVTWYRHALATMQPEYQRWQQHLPEHIRLQLGPFNVLALHASFESNNEFVFRSSDDQIKQRALTNANADIVLAGHSGVPFGQAFEQGYWLNAGVIGMPANNGQAHTYYMTIEAIDGQWRARWHALHYEVSTTQAAMEKAGLNTPYQTALATGRWPSMDVLPNLEKSQQGQSIDLPDLELHD
jgi:predicted phosphodiesterase